MSLREHTLLFIDDMVIAERHGLSRVPSQAIKHPANPILRRQFPWEEGAVYIFGSVHREPTTGLFRMWYQAIDAQAGTAPGHMTICYAESDDGVSWRKPLMPLISYKNRKATNIVLGYSAYPGNPYCSSVVLDEEATNAGERYKMLVWYEQWTDQLSRFNGAASFYSADGLRWDVYPGAEPAIAIDVRVVDGEVQRGEGPNDANSVSPDRLDGQFVNWQVVRQFISKDKQVYARDLMAGSRLERVIAMQTSSDFVHWTEPRKIITPSDDDPDYVQFYGMGGFRYGNYWLGTLWMYYVHDQSMDLELALSRDGYHWTRPFPGRRLVCLGTAGAFDAGMIMSASAPVVVGDQIYIYYGGEDHRHDEAGYAEIGLATLPLDRWAGLQTGKRGFLRTVPFTFEGTALELNAYAHGGEICVALFNESGRPMPGYDVAQCVPVVGDQTHARLRWIGAADGDLSHLRGDRICIHCDIQNATLYSVSVV